MELIGGRYGVMKYRHGGMGVSLNVKHGGQDILAIQERIFSFSQYVELKLKDLLYIPEMNIMAS